jgi:hypothetical protein
MIITMGLLAGFMVILTGIFVSGVDVESQTSSYSALTGDGRTILARLAYDIHRASAITAPASLGGSGSSLGLTINGDSYVYAIDSGRFGLTINGGSVNYLTGDKSTISALNFEELGNSGGQAAVRYSFTVSADNNRTTESQTYTSTTELRQ